MNYNNFNHLQSLINSNKKHIKLDDDILLDDDLEYKKFIEGIIINKNIVIDGNKRLINAKDLNRIFKITSGNVVLKNMRLECGYSDNGGVIYNRANLVLENCIIRFNYGKRGGAIFNEGYLQINNCRIANNIAQNGGAIVNRNLLIVKNTHFEKNEAINANSILNYGNMYHVNCSYKTLNNPIDEVIDADNPINNEDKLTLQANISDNKKDCVHDMSSKYDLKIEEFTDKIIKFYDKKYDTAIIFHISKNYKWIDYSNTNLKSITMDDLLKSYNQAPVVLKKACPTLNFCGYDSNTRGEYKIIDNKKNICIYHLSYLSGYSLTLYHEMAHALANLLKSNYKVRRHFKSEIEYTYKNIVEMDWKIHSLTGGHKYVSKYAHQSFIDRGLREDWAESLGICSFRDIPDKLEARLIEENGNRNKYITYEEFQKKYPNRFSFFDYLLSYGDQFI